jgi:hypothetical protein
MMPSATVKGPDMELVMTVTLRPIIPTSLTPKSNRCGSCIIGSAFDSNENEYRGLCRDCGGDEEMSPSRLHLVSGENAEPVSQHLLYHHPMPVRLRILIPAFKLHTCAARC